ncbi:MAG: serine hydroxymethyltransferase [Candidatus Hydrogenedentota bacterium]|nr:MAG: serine hydroxymethyltransferase [Candidatus Hydrogenedentota bacterium]
MTKTQRNDILTAPLVEADPEVSDWIRREASRQNGQLEMIASENFTSRAVLEAMGTILTNKYAEGYPGRRYYGGCEFVDEIERVAIERAKRLFGAEHANVQPHSGSSANLAAYFALASPGDVIMGMRLDQGGHLTHGHKVNFSGKTYSVVSYGVDPETGLIDYEALERSAKEARPRIIVSGASAYPRRFDFERIGKIAEEIGAVHVADMAHYAGLIAAGLYPNPVPHAGVVTSTTHKTLRGPRSGFILCRNELAGSIDKAVFPGTQGGPLMHVVAAKAVCFGQALTESFRKYQETVLLNARTLAKVLLNRGFRLVSGGTDSHLVLLDLRDRKVTGRDAEAFLEAAGITVNKNAVPGDPRKPAVTSGIRIGTPALTSRGMGPDQLELIGNWIADVIESGGAEDVIATVREKVAELCSAFPAALG